MKQSKQAVQAANAQLPHGVKYPAELLAKHNAGNKLDREYLAYLTDGGPSGAYHQWLTLLARNAEAKTLVELGNRYGTSTIALYAGLKPDQTLYSVDIVKDQRFVPESIFQDKRVRFLVGSSLDLSIYEQHGMEVPMDIDILWIDTLHVYDQVSAEFTVFEPLLADEAIVVLDDINVNDMRRFFDEVGFEKFDLTSACHQSGFGAFLYERPSADRNRSAQERLIRALLRSSRIIFERYASLRQQSQKQKQGFSLFGRSK